MRRGRATEAADLASPIRLGSGVGLGLELKPSRVLGRVGFGPTCQIELDHRCPARVLLQDGAAIRATYPAV